MLLFLVGNYDMLSANRGLVITLNRQQFVFDAGHNTIRITDCL